jgi:hypothetical protein
LFLGRHRRQLLAALSLPSALLIATIWRQKAWILPSPGLGLAPQMLIMMGMVASVHLALARWLTGRKVRGFLPQLGALLTFLGIILVAASAHFSSRILRTAIHVYGAGVWLTGILAVLVDFRRQRRQTPLGRGDAIDLPVLPPCDTE